MTRAGLDRLQSKFSIAEDNDTDEAGVILGSFACTYMGSIPTDTAGGPELVAECIDKLKARN